MQGFIPLICIQGWFLTVTGKCVCIKPFTDYNWHERFILYPWEMGSVMSRNGSCIDSTEGYKLHDHVFFLT